MVSNGDLTRAVESGSYKTESSERLRELLTGALNIGGANPIALHRINHAADIIKKELEARDAAQREKNEDERHRKIEGRLAEIEQEAKRPRSEYKTMGFWIAVFAFIVAVFALLRDYWNFTSQ